MIKIEAELSEVSRMNNNKAGWAERMEHTGKLLDLNYFNIV